MKTFLEEMEDINKLVRRRFYFEKKDTEKTAKKEKIYIENKRYKSRTHFIRFRFVYF